MKFWNLTLWDLREGIERAIPLWLDAAMIVIIIAVAFVVMTRGRND